MRRTRSSLASFLLLPALLLTLPAPTTGFRSHPDRHGAQPQGAVARRGAFGFEPGEERRYVLEGRDSLREGESGTWSLRLVRMGGEDGDEALFEFSSWLESPPGRVEAEAVGQVVAEETRGTLRVNRHGFPLELELEVRRQVHRMGQVAFTVRYRLEDRTYEKRVYADGEDWGYGVRVPPGPGVDRDAPLGIYLYLPDALDCTSGWEEPSASGGRSAGGRLLGFLRPPECEGRLPAFANPALAALALPALWEAGDGDHEVVYFGPTGNVLGSKKAMSLGFTSANRNRSRAARVGPEVDDDRLERATDLTNYYRRTELDLGEARDLDIGGRTVRANRIELGGTSTALWVDIGDRVVRADLGRNPLVGGERWIRLLLPSEY